MKIYDISRELFSSEVYPGDLHPSFERVSCMSGGDLYNLSNLRMCAHNSTHIDAPFHFINDGKTAEQLELCKCVGEAAVITMNGDIGAAEIEGALAGGVRRLLIKGGAVVTLEAARALRDGAA